MATKRMRKTPIYMDGVSWIAENDEPTLDDVNEISNLISVLLLADLFGRTPEEVAIDVLRVRERGTVAVDR